VSETEGETNGENADAEGFGVTASRRVRLEESLILKTRGVWHPGVRSGPSR